VGVCVVIGSLVVAGYIGYVLNRPKNSESSGISEGVISNGAGSSKTPDSSFNTLGLDETLGKSADDGSLKKLVGGDLCVCVMNFNAIRKCFSTTFYICYFNLWLRGWKQKKGCLLESFGCYLFNEFASLGYS